ncbi:MAG: PDZ domain-containing protein [Fibrobacter sp.]|nr:PDZ domain-containing protein [Fibrobacter sp.]
MKRTIVKVMIVSALVVGAAMADETFNGIGVAIAPAENGAEVLSVIPGTPAADSKLQKGDVIISVNGSSTYCKKMEDVQSMLRGEKNKPVEIVFVSAGDTLEATISRAELVVKNLDSENAHGAELEAYASAVQSDKKLVAIMSQGDVIDGNNSIEGKNVDCIYVDKDVVKEPASSTREKVPEKVRVKGFDRNAISFELETAGEALVTVTNSSGVVVSSIQIPRAQKGINRTSWDLGNAPSDRYVVSVEHHGSYGAISVLLK